MHTIATESFQVLVQNTNMQTMVHWCVNTALLDEAFTDTNTNTKKTSVLQRLQSEPWCIPQALIIN